MNKEESIKYIKIAADKGNSNVMYFYGTLLEERKYVEKKSRGIHQILSEFSK